jgi:hypothetical protein
MGQQHTDLRNSYRFSNLVPAALALLISIAMTIAFWPGVGTWEVLQFSQQQSLPVMNDWKSPFVAVLYWLSDDFFNSTGPILFVQQVLFWTGLALLTMNTFSSHRGQVIFFLAVAVLPPLWITEIMLWKEAWTLSFLSLSIGAIFAHLRTGRRLYAVAATLSAILLTATRHNAVLLTFPTFFVVARSIADQASLALRKYRRMIFITAFVILMLMALGFSWVVNIKGIQRCHIWHQALLWDLAAISISEEQMLIPDTFRKAGDAGSLENIRYYFTPYNSDPLFFSKRAPLKLYGTAWSGCDEQLPLDMLLKSWLDTVLNNPGAYLRHRFIYLIHLLNFPDVSQDRFGKAYYRIDSEFTPRANRSELFKLLRTNPIYEALALGIPIRGGIYPIVFLLSVIVLSRKSAIENIYLWVLWLAGLAYFASFLVIGSGALMRYLTVYAVLGPAILAGRWGMQFQKGLISSIKN